MRAVTSGNWSANSFSSLACTRSRASRSLVDDDGLGHEVVVELHIERQVEADGPAADIGRETGDVGIARKRIFQALGLRFGCRDGGVLHERHRDQELGPVGRREELLLHEAQAEDGGPEGDERDRDGEPTMPHAQFEHLAEGAHEAAGLSGVRLHARGQHCEPDHRREDDGDEPRCDERQGDDGEQREAVLPGVVGGKADW